MRWNSSDSTSLSLARCPTSTIKIQFAESLSATLFSYQLTLLPSTILLFLRSHSTPANPSARQQCLSPSSFSSSSTSTAQPPYQPPPPPPKPSNTQIPSNLASQAIASRPQARSYSPTPRTRRAECKSLMQSATGLSARACAVRISPHDSVLLGDTPTEAGSRRLDRIGANHRPCRYLCLCRAGTRQCRDGVLRCLLVRF